MGNTKSKIHVENKKISLQKKNIKLYPINNDAVTVKYVGNHEHNKYDQKKCNQQKCNQQKCNQQKCNQQKCNNEPKYSYIYKGVPGGWYV